MADFTEEILEVLLLCDVTLKLYQLTCLVAPGRQPQAQVGGLSMARLIAGLGFPQL